MLRWLVLVLLLPAQAFAAYVNWLDPLAYRKPVPIAINEPDETTVTNKYWINLSGGSGTTCSQASPCGDMDSVLGKAGIAGGPAIIYVKGTASYSWFNDTVHGSGDADCRVTACTNWILVKPWPAGTPGCVTECAGIFGGNSNMNSANVGHIIFDGGPNLNLKFNSNGSTAQYVNHINGGASYVIIYRTQMFCTGNNQQLGWAVGDTAISDHVWFINNEFYGCSTTGDQIATIYAGPGGGGGYTNLYILNNVMRDMYGECIEINPRATSGPLTITGNAIHNCGFGTCSTAWNCRPGITVGNQGPGTGNNSTILANNLIWNVGSGCIWNRGDGTPAALIYNNTCYDYGKGNSTVGGDPQPQGITGFSNNGKGTVANNIIYAPNGTAPFDSSPMTETNNICAAACGTSSQVYNTSTTLASTTENSANFLLLGASSIAIDHGANGAAATSMDYRAASRPVGSAYDIGAFESGSSGSAPSVPGNPR